MTRPDPTPDAPDAASLPSAGRLVPGGDGDTRYGCEHCEATRRFIPTLRARIRAEVLAEVEMAALMTRGQTIFQVEVSRHVDGIIRALATKGTDDAR